MLCNNSNIKKNDRLTGYIETHALKWSSSTCAGNFPAYLNMIKEENIKLPLYGNKFSHKNKGIH